MKKILLVPIMMLAALCLVVLPGCGGPSVEDLIRQDLTEQLDEIKQGGDDLMDEISEASGEDFATLGIDAKEFATSYLDGFDYSIGDITVEDRTATAKVDLTMKSLGDILSGFETQFADKLSSLDLAAQADEQGLYTMAGELLMQVTQDTEPKTVTIEVPYESDDEGVWSESDGAETAILNAMMS